MIDKSDIDQTLGDPLSAGSAALACGAWDEARLLRGRSARWRDVRGAGRVEYGGVVAQGFDLVPEQALLAIYEGYFALILHHDSAMARKLGEQATMIGRTLGVIGLEMLGLALEGLARVSAGEIVEGMRCLDEFTTAAASGEMTDVDARVTVCCYLIYACEPVRDLDRGR